MPTLEISDEVQAVITASTRNSVKPATLVQELIQSAACDRRHGRAPESLQHVEARELARFIDETSTAPRDDFGSYLTAGLDDMPLADRTHFNYLTRRLLIGEITVQQQADLNEICVRAMLAFGAGEVRHAVEQADVRTLIERGGVR